MKIDAFFFEQAVREVAQHPYRIAAGELSDVVEEMGEDIFHELCIGLLVAAHQGGFVMPQDIMSFGIIAGIRLGYTVHELMTQAERNVA